MSIRNQLAFTTLRPYEPWRNYGQTSARAPAMLGRGQREVFGSGLTYRETSACAKGRRTSCLLKHVQVLCVFEYVVYVYECLRAIARARILLICACFFTINLHIRHFFKRTLISSSGHVRI